MIHAHELGEKCNLMVTIKKKIYPKVKHKNRNSIAKINRILLAKSNLMQGGNLVLIVCMQPLRK